MTTHTLMAGAPGLPLPGGSILKFEAISPTTGAAITGVKVTQVVVYGDLLEDVSFDVSSGPYMLVPGATGGA